MELDLRTIDVERLHSSAAVIDRGVVELFDPKGVIAFDIETGPLPIDALMLAMTPFPDLQPFDENSVKLGNLKDGKKIAEKIVAARESHVENWQKSRDTYEREFVEKAALDPMRGQVLCIGYGDKDGQRVVHAAEEADLLVELWSMYFSVARSGGILVGWNTHRFDLPFCRQRSFFHDLPVPREMLKNGRFYSSQLVDLMAEWCGGSGTGFAGLDKVSRFLGCGGKNGEGADFSRMWNEDRDEAVRYLVNDLDMTIRVAKRLGF